MKEEAAGVNWQELGEDMWEWISGERAEVGMGGQNVRLAGGAVTGLGGLSCDPAFNTSSHPNRSLRRLLPA